MVKNCVKLCLKLLNCSIGIGGIAITVYGVFFIKAWQPDDKDHHDFDFPWLFHGFLGIGVVLCAITCLGHIAANTANSCYLSSYITIVFLLLVSETAITAYAFTNPKWEKELPSKKFDDFKDFVESNDEICKWFLSFIILVQGVCILLATILWTHEADEANTYESEDERLPPDTPLLGRLAQWQVADPSIV